LRQTKDDTMTTTDSPLRATVLRAGFADATAEAIAEVLNVCVLDVRNPAPPGSSFLEVTNPRGALCQLTICDNGMFDWQYCCRDRSRVDPAMLATVALCILGTDPATSRFPAVTRYPRSLIGQTGGTLADQDMNVRFKVLDKDDQFFEICTMLAIANSAHSDRGTVCVADDDLIW
jgi:hypothetical protein